MYVPSFPTKRYSIVYADPPWEYRDKALAGKRGACCKYPVLGLENIKALPVKQIQMEDCALFLWATWPLLDQCLDVMRAWGFTYKTAAFVWLKENKHSKGLKVGMGGWTRANTEVCLLGVRGRMKRLSASVRQPIVSPIRAHSKKPDEVYSRIEELLGDLPRLELFATQRWPGWDSWGSRKYRIIDPFPSLFDSRNTGRFA